MVLAITTLLLALMAAWTFDQQSNKATANTADSEQQCVILLHGLGRSASSMNKIAQTLQDRGYRVWNKSYPSTSEKVKPLAAEAIKLGLDHCLSSTRPAQQVHFVTHSMGGILVRAYLQDQQLPQLGRIVMISPPNKGSEIVDLLGDFSLFQYLMGPAAGQMGTDKQSIVKQLNPIAGQIGIIAGKSTSDPWFSPFIPGDDDGKVSVESAKLEEMADFLIVDNGHTFIMRADEVIQQVQHFLHNGKFSKTPD